MPLVSAWYTCSLKACQVPTMKWWDKGSVRTVWTGSAWPMLCWCQPQTCPVIGLKLVVMVVSHFDWLNQRLLTLGALVYNPHFKISWFEVWIAANYVFVLAWKFSCCGRYCLVKHGTHSRFREMPSGLVIKWPKAVTVTFDSPPPPLFAFRSV